MTLVYVAGPLFNSHERWYLEQIAAALDGAGYETFLPHRDAGLLTQLNMEDRGRIFRDDLRAMERADLCVALLTGPDHDSGTCAEMGYFMAKGVPCYGISDDYRWLNNFIWGVCNEGKNLFKKMEDLLAALGSAANAS